MDRKPRISGLNKFLMILIASIFDLLEFFFSLLFIGLFINSLLTIIKYSIFWFWFFIQGVSFIGNSKRLSAMGGSFALEMIPVVNSLPMFTAGIIRIIYITNKEADDYEQIQKKEQVDNKSAHLNPKIIREKNSS